MDATIEQMEFDPSESLRDRLRAYTEGACFALANMELDEPEKQKVEGSFRTALQDKLAILDTIVVSTQDYSIFVGEFIEDLVSISNGHLTIKDVSLGAAYWTWQHHPRHPIVSDVNLGDVSMHMVESVIAPKMSAANQAVFAAIHQPTPPKWFTQLNSWEQTYLKTITPPTAKDWSAFEKVLPSTLRRFPGLANATKKTSTITDAQGHQHTKTSYRQGLPTAFNMPKQDYASSAQYNLRQMLDAIQPEVQQNFKTFWGLPKDTAIQAPVVLLGLLTHKKDANIFGIAGYYMSLGGKEDNTQRTDEKTTAIAAIAKDYPHLQLIDLNIGVNWFRGHFLGTRVDHYIQTLETFLNDHETQFTSLSDDAKQKWTHARLSLAHLQNHNQKDLVNGRNKNLFTAALCHYVADQFGGAVIPNCKSAKDRTAQELIMADAIALFATLYGQLPQYDAPQEDRQKLVDLFVAIYKTRHHHAVANNNSPGSMGIKDEYMLDQDIINALNADNTGPLHTQSKHLAKLNKAEDLSTLYKVFRSVMYLGMLLGCPLVTVWQCICSYVSSGKAVDNNPVYTPISQVDPDQSNKPDESHSNEPPTQTM